MLNGLRFNLPSFRGRGANRVGFDTSQDRLSLVQGIKRVVTNHRGNIAGVVHPTTGGTRGLSTILGRAMLPPVAVARSSVFSMQAEGGAGIASTFASTLRSAGIGSRPLAQATAQGEPAGLPSGRGTYGDPIMLPGVTVTPTKGPNWLLIAAAAVLAYMLFVRR